MSMLIEKRDEGIDVHEIYEEYLEELREITPEGHEIIPCYTEREFSKLLYGKKAVSIIPDDSSKGLAGVNIEGLRAKREEQRKAEKKYYLPTNNVTPGGETVLAFKVEPTKTTMTMILEDRSIQIDKELVETENGLEPVYTRINARKIGENEHNAFYDKTLEVKDRDKKIWEFIDQKVDKNFSNIIYDWYHLTESWLTHSNNLMTNTLEKLSLWSKLKPYVIEDELDMNNLDSKINAYFVNSRLYNVINTEPFHFDDVYPNLKEPYEEIDKKYDELEKEQELEEQRETEKSETIGDINISYYIRRKKEKEKRPLTNEQLNLLANKLKFLEEHNMPITEEQRKIIRRASENEKMMAFEEKIEKFKEQKEQRERALAEKEKQIKAHNEEIEERINNPESYVRDREDYFKDMNELLEGLKTIHQIDSGLLSQEQETTLQENEEFFRMKDESSKESHIRDEGMSDTVREWYKNEYSEDSSKGKSR